MARKKKIDRNTQLGKIPEVVDQLLKVFKSVEAGFTDQVQRADNNLDYWDIINCQIGPKQFYSGISKLFVGLIFQGVEARKTRFLNSLFPQNGRYIDVTSEDGEIPHAEMALLEMYVDRARLKTDVVPSLLVAGDVEGQVSLCVTWNKRARHVVSRETVPIRIGGIEHPDLDPVEKLTERTIDDDGPDVDVVLDNDLLILPATSNTAEQALAAGGSITTICRWSQSRIEDLIDTDEIDTDFSAEMLAEMKGQSAGGSIRDTPKKLADAAGIKAQGKYLQVYRTWTRIKVDGEKRLVLAYFGGDDTILGCKLCPYWNDKPDIITRSVRKSPGVAKGMSIVARCADIQYAANDMLNEGMDSATYSLLPVIMTDPEKNPKVGSMVMDLMAVWETNPRDTQALQFPQLYQHAFNIVQAAKQEIMATLGVNAAMLPQATGVPGRKRNQAEVALEQQVDLLSTAVELSSVESLLSETIERFAEYDAQFRDEAAMVRSVGELGVKAQMQEVLPMQIGKRWRFRWYGVEVSRTAQQIQQQIAYLNVIRGFANDPSVAQAGYRLNPVPFIRTASETVFGPRLAPEIFQNMKDQLSVDPELENEIMLERMPAVVHPPDDDPKHIQAHMQGMQQTGDVAARAQFQMHIQAHQQQMQMKQMAKAMQQMQMQQGGQGQPQGGGAPPRGPAPGGQPAMPRPVRGPPGALHPDQLAKTPGVISMPRRTG